MRKDISKKMVATFTELLINQFKLSGGLLEKNTNVNRTLFLPRAFSGTHTAVNSFYSTDREHLMLVFRKSNKSTFNYSLTNGNVFDIFDFFDR